MTKVERSSILDVLIKNNWYKAQVVLSDMCLTVTLLDNYLDSILNSNQSNQGINEIRRVRIVKTTSDNFGVSIKGGKENNMPIFISKIFKDSPADNTGQLNIGDSIISVNGESLIDATHEAAVKALKKAGNKVDLEVKYLREVMLQYKKASLLPDIGWSFDINTKSASNNNHHNNQNNNQDDQISHSSSLNESFFLPRSVSATGSNLTGKLKSDTRIVPLLLCHLFKYSQQTDLKSSLILRCPDEMSAFTWASAILNEIHETNLTALAEANMNLSSVLNSTIKYMGFLSEKADSNNYLPVFLVLTNKELLFFDKVPYTASEWKYPTSRYSLEHCRLVKGPIDEIAATPTKMNGSNGTFGKEQQQQQQNKLNSFALRIGTSNGVVIVQLSSASYQTLLIWAKNIFESTCNAAIALQEISFNCVFEGKKCELVINIDNGFTINDKQTNEIILKKEFSELINSSDDNSRFVTLQFKNEKLSRDFDMMTHPKPFIFTLHTFLFVKMYKLGII